MQEPMPLEFEGPDGDRLWVTANHDSVDITGYMEMNAQEVRSLIAYLTDWLHVR